MLFDRCYRLFTGYLQKLDRTKQCSERSSSGDVRLKQLVLNILRKRLFGRLFWVNSLLPRQPIQTPKTETPKTEAHTLFTIKTAEPGDAKKHVHIPPALYNYHASQPSPCDKMQCLGSLPLAVNTRRMDIRCHQTRRHSRCQSQSERMTGCKEDSAVGIDCFPINLSSRRPYVRKFVFWPICLYQRQIIWNSNEQE